MSDMIYSDALLSTKTSNNEVVTMLPITRYQNILSGPKVIDDINKLGLSPFAFLVDDEIDD